MRSNSNNGTIDLVPLTLNVVNLQGLKLICRKTSERYERKRSKEKQKLSKIKSPDEISKEFKSNKIYFKKKKEKDDQLYFSDYRIKYGLEFTYLPTNAPTYNNIEQQIESLKALNNHIINSKSNCQKLKPIPSNPMADQETIYAKQSNQLGIIKNREVIQRGNSKTEEKRHASTKMQKRKTPNFIKMSFSHKNYKKVNIPDSKVNGGEHDNRLDGWAIQSPNVYEIDKKLDITSYGDPEFQETRNYFSERKKPKEENRFFSRIKKPKIFTKP